MRPSPRKFTVLDALVLIAATAAGLGWWWASAAWDSLRLIPNQREWEVIHHLPVLTAAIGSLLSAWSLALFLLQCRKPRPRWRRLFRQAGVVACGVASAGVIHAFLWSIVAVACDRPGDWQTCFSYLVLRTDHYSRDTVGPAVAGAWLALALFEGRWPDPSGSIDSLGRLVGIGWICVLFLTFAQDSLIKLMM